MPAAKDLNPFDNPFGYAVRRHRLRLGLTQEQLGKRIGYSGDAVGKFEKGDVAPSIDEPHSGERGQPFRGYRSLVAHYHDHLVDMIGHDLGIVTEVANDLAEAG